MSGSNVEVTVYSASGESCRIPSLDNWYDTFERCRLDLFAGEYLKDCDMFEVTDGNIETLRLKITGEDAWTVNYFRYISVFM